MLHRQSIISIITGHNRIDSMVYSIYIFILYFILFFFQIEWLARTNFKHRPLRRNIPQPRKHKVPKRHVQSNLDTSFIVY